MKVVYKAMGGKLEFEVEASTQKELFEEIASIQEVFDQDTCGACKKNDIKFVVRNVKKDDEEFEYLEAVCVSCRAKLAIGVNKKGGGLFPKRFDKESNKWLANNGWTKWERKGNAEKEATTQTKDESVPF